jgi:hypothetical protein
MKRGRKKHLGVAVQLICIAYRDGRGRQRRKIR